MLKDWTKRDQEIGGFEEVYRNLEAEKQWATTLPEAVYPVSAASNFARINEHTIFLVRKHTLCMQSPVSWKISTMSRLNQLFSAIRTVSLFLTCLPTKTLSSVSTSEPPVSTPSHSKYLSGKTNECGRLQPLEHTISPEDYLRLSYRSRCVPGMTIYLYQVSVQIARNIHCLHASRSCQQKSMVWINEWTNINRATQSLLSMVMCYALCSALLLSHSAHQET